MGDRRRAPALRCTAPSPRPGCSASASPRRSAAAAGDPVDAAVVTEEILHGGGSTGVVASLFTHGIALPHIVRNGSADLVERFVRPTLAGRD